MLSLSTHGGHIQGGPCDSKKEKKKSGSHSLGMELWSRECKHAVYPCTQTTTTIAHRVRGEIHLVLIHCATHCTTFDSRSLAPCYLTPRSIAKITYLRSPLGPKILVTHNSRLPTWHMTGSTATCVGGEYISQLVHSPQAIWQHFILSHSTEMHNPHLMACIMQCSQVYFTSMAQC